MASPRISLCMIVRDEAEMLPACLESVQGVVDEVVVVDTGSTDATRSLAQGAGAKVVEQPWNDDFAAPRNRSIEESSGDWILVLDADERLTPAAGLALRRVVSQADFDCGLLPLHNATHVDADLEAVVRGEERINDVAFLPRLMRRTDDLAYTGIIHESVGDWLFRSKRTTKFLKGVDIVHLGGVPSVRERRNKSERNITLLERYCEHEPKDITPFGYLAHEYLESGQREKAIAVADRGWALLEDGQFVMDLSVIRLASARAWLQVQSGDAVDGLETIDRGLRLVPNHPDFFFVRGCAFEMLALKAQKRDEREAYLNRSLEAYEAALAQDGELWVQKFIQGCTSWAVQVRIGTNHLLSGRDEPALEAFARAKALKSDNEETVWGTVECLLATGKTVAAVQAVGDTMNERPDGWLLASLGAEAAGMIDQMATLLAQAQERLPEGFIAPHRRELYNDALAALSMYQVAEASVPGPMGQLAMLTQSRFEAVPMASARDLNRALAGRIIKYLLLNGHSERVLCLVNAEAERFLPGISRLVREVLDSIETGPSK